MDKPRGQAGKLENLKEEMRRNKVDIMRCGELMSDEFRMFYSSGDAKGSYGVGVVLGPCVKDEVISVHATQWSSR